MKTSDPEHRLPHNDLRIAQMRTFIGRRAHYHGRLYEIIEVLEDVPSLVLRECGAHTTIQADQHGEAHRRVPPTLTLAIPAADDGSADLEGVGLELMENSPEPATADSMAG